MSRKLPLCAYCGESLHLRQAAGRTTIVFNGIHGHPFVGWHFPCWSDEHAHGLVVSTRLAVINARGAGRALLVGGANLAETLADALTKDHENDAV